MPRRRRLGPASTLERTRSGRPDRRRVLGEGRRAAKRGEPITACPYQADDERTRRTWEIGWYEGWEATSTDARKFAHRMVQKPRCPYCDRPATYWHRSDALYQGHDYGPVWVCLDCDAWSRCAAGSHRPLGQLANAGLRRERSAVYELVESLAKRAAEIRGWSERAAKVKTYAWLADKLEIIPRHFRIAALTLEQCRAAREAIREGLASGRRRRRSERQPEGAEAPEEQRPHGRADGAGRQQRPPGR